MPPRNTIESILARLEKTSGHWIWTGQLTHDGYGVVSWHGKRRRVHVIVYEHFHGPVPPGHDVDHIQDNGLCGIRNCADPDHLRAVTHRANILSSTNFIAVKAAQTHCVNGHRFTPAVTRIRPNGTRECKVCKAVRAAAYRARLKENA